MERQSALFPFPGKCSRIARRFSKSHSFSTSCAQSTHLARPLDKEDLLIVSCELGKVGARFQMPLAAIVVFGFCLVLGLPTLDLLWTNF
jgi:hypothetical protein